MGVSQDMEGLHDRIDGLVRARDEARARKDYSRADAIKAELLAIRAGTVIVYRVALMDAPGHTDWAWTV